VLPASFPQRFLSLEVKKACLSPLREISDYAVTPWKRLLLFLFQTWTKVSLSFSLARDKERIVSFPSDLQDAFNFLEASREFLFTPSCHERLSFPLPLPRTEGCSLNPLAAAQNRSSVSTNVVWSTGLNFSTLSQPPTVLPPVFPYFPSRSAPPSRISDPPPFSNNAPPHHSSLFRSPRSFFI